MALETHQKISRVLFGKPFGDGRDGAYSSLTITKKSCSGTATTTTLTIASSGFTNGDVILIHQTRGTGVGQWEINKVLSGGGSTSLTLQIALQYTYTTSGASAAQVVKIPMYSSMTIANGNTLSAPNWTTVSEQSTPSGGIIPIACKGTLTIAGTLNAKGNITNTDIFDEQAFIGGKNSNAAYAEGLCAEGTAGRGQTATTAANGNGGGGGDGGNGIANGVLGGGGGGHGATGSSTGGGSGGSSDGSADLTDMVIGGGGGGGAKNAAEGNNYDGQGAGGGGIVIVFAKDFVVTGSVDVHGEDGGASSAMNDHAGGGGGGGAGGAILVACQTAILGTNLLVSTGGVGGAGYNGGASGGAGAVGRIAVHYSGSVTGTTNPTLNATFDKTLRSISGMIQII